MSTETAYDSRPDTISHIGRVAELLAKCVDNIGDRAYRHDRSKLEEPEKSTFDQCTLKLKAMAYGSPEYKAALAELKPALDHHYAANSHHPEHYPDGVAGMSLFDLLEMVMDWKAATERMAGGGDIHRSLEINTERFKLSPQLVSIISNTLYEMQWLKKATPPVSP